MRHDGRLWDLGAEAFRTGRMLAGHSEQPVTIREQPRTALGNIDSLAYDVGVPGEWSITERLDMVE
ncbi:hypothetical protein ACFC09_32655 [Streptomyces sp. NPDC056161]|uniref:hypothetical protein n=1 Tax=Streptomyces sp. NPDC056161 TaxID=3345732 RepID=UPI0035D60B0E